MGAAHHLARDLGPTRARRALRFRTVTSKGLYLPTFESPASITAGSTAMTDSAMLARHAMVWRHLGWACAAGLSL